MSKKTLLILLILIAIVAAALGAKELLNRRQAGGRQALSIEVLKRIDPASVSEVDIVKGEDAVALKREGEKWMVGDAEADAEKIKSVLDAVKNASFTDPVARARENHDKLGVGEKGVKVVVKQGDKTFEFRIGNGGPTFDSAYVRLEGEDAVFLADVNLGFQFSSTKESWQKKEESKDAIKDEAQ